ncbi:hydroxyisourate hydrolase [Rhizobium tumorigenes]|uniref:5-hydroxyisourate hydrolase n=1 Tax=Rhizobium tumorigenes TaxID=2041385 RepID=A0AAF1K2T8_9HYPH|nr:hydroxyisourate hydrolase [Rhizobium tumorigenes]WFR94280.1 hydroxyisourate hydrolase [Rhizobium tumorigenes]
MTGLTTHVLDTALGKPAEGLQIVLSRIDGEARTVLKTLVTNADGRVDGGPMLVGDSFVAGTYELQFHAGDYLRRTGCQLPEPAFLDVVPIRFGIADTTAHYHVPLLISPYGYSTYRGS